MGRTIDLRKLQKLNITATIDLSGGTGTETSVPQSATSVTLKAANANRKEIIIVNNSTKDMWISFTGTATVDKGIFLPKNQNVFIEDKYTGIISGIWTSAAGGGSAEITEIT